MKGVGAMRLNIAAALAALAMPLDSRDRMAVGRATLDSMFTPRFAIPGDSRHDDRGKRKHRNSGTTSPRPNYCNNAGTGKPHCGAQEAARFIARGQAGDDREWRKRMAWLERNAHVIARRDEQQAKAMSDEGGRNAIHWGRR